MATIRSEVDVEAATPMPGPTIDSKPEPKRDPTHGLVLVRDVLLLVLASTAGWMDAISYLDLGGVFTANMTGHAVLVGIAIMGADTRKAALGAFAIAGFFCGALAGSWFVRAAPLGAVWPADVTRALAVECVILMCAATAWYFYSAGNGKHQALYLFAIGAAMGIQAGAVRALNVAGVSTAYITGTLAMIAADLVGSGRGHRTDRLQASALLASIWLFYVAGAAGGALVSRSASGLEIAAPAGVVVGCVIVAAVVFGIRRIA